MSQAKGRSKVDNILYFFMFALPGWLRITIIVLLIIVNYGAEFLVKRSILKVYRKTESAEAAMNRLRICNQYFLAILQIGTVLPIGLLVAKYFAAFGKVGQYIFTILFLFATIILVNIGQLLIINKTYKKIRGTTQSLFGQIRDIVLTFLFIMLPVGLLGMLSLLTAEIKMKNPTLKSILSAMLPIGMIFLFNLVLPVFYPKLFKAVPLPDDKLNGLLDELFARAGLKKAKIYQWPTKEKKLANALVTGLVKPKVLISDYYLENAAPDEIAAIIAHEVGHLKHKHLLKRLLYLIGGSGEVYLVGYLLEWYEIKTGTEINPSLGLVILLVPFLLYITLGLLKYYRSQERKADAFALQIGVKPEVMITALLKLARLNHTTTKLKKVDEGFQTHPSIARRIRQIEEISGYKYDLNLEDSFQKNP